MPVKGSSKLSETFLAALVSGNCAGTAEALNAGCQCVSLDRQALVGALAPAPPDRPLQANHAESRPHQLAQ